MADDNIATTKRLALAASAGGLVLLVCWFVWWARPPQIGPDKETIKTVERARSPRSPPEIRRESRNARALHALKMPENCRRTAALISTA